MSDFSVEALLRDNTGRSETRRLRRTGKTPAIIYGGGKPDLAIAFEYFVISKLLDKEAFHSSMIEIDVQGAGKNTVILKDAQYDPIKDTVTHLDFLRVSSSDTITLEVSVVPVNDAKCPGVTKGGLVEVIRHSLKVTCHADSVPAHIEVDCSNLNIGDTVHIEDVVLPAGVEVHHEVNFTVLNIAAQKTSGGEAEAEAA